MKKIIIILILLSIISAIGCSYDQELIEEQEKNIQDLEEKIGSLEEKIKKLETEKDKLVENNIIMAREIHKFDQEKAFYKGCLNYIEDAVFGFYINYYTIDKAMREIQDGIDCIRSRLGY